MLILTLLLYISCQVLVYFKYIQFFDLIFTVSGFFPLTQLSIGWMHLKTRS